jgi:hypothetical protein
VLLKCCTIALYLLHGRWDHGMLAVAPAERERRQQEAELAQLAGPPDLPLEMIAEEVKESWRLKEVHVEKLMQKARTRSPVLRAAVLLPVLVVHCMQMYVSIWRCMPACLVLMCLLACG